MRYLSTSDSSAAVGESMPIHQAMMRALWASAADTVIAPVQDLLGLGTEARMNTPGVGEGNWLFRVDAQALTEELADSLRRLTETYGRVPRPVVARQVVGARRARRVLSAGPRSKVDEQTNTTY